MLKSDYWVLLRYALLSLLLPLAFAVGIALVLSGAYLLTGAL